MQDSRTGITWVNIPAGSFMMGSKESSDQRPVHQVTVQAFQMSETEVTVGQYRKCVEAGRCTAPIRCRQPQIGGINWTDFPGGNEDYPI